MTPYHLKKIYLHFALLFACEYKREILLTRRRNTTHTIEDDDIYYNDLEVPGTIAYLIEKHCRSIRLLSYFDEEAF